MAHAVRSPAETHDNDHYAVDQKYSDRMQAMAEGAVSQDSGVSIVYGWAGVMALRNLWGIANAGMNYFN